MISIDPRLINCAVIAVLVAALGLAGCGRKPGQLDLPQAELGAKPEQPGQAQGLDAQGQPVAAPNQKKAAPMLDWMIN